MKVLSRTRPTQQQQRTLDRMSWSADRAIRLIADLLDFTQARLGSGLVAHRAPMALHEVVAKAIDELSDAFPQRTFEHTRTGTGEVQGDIDRLIQLLGNLVANAAAYGEPGTAIVVVSAIAERSFSISVSNVGTPIPPDLLPKLFQPLVRGVENVGDARSVGLGLYIVEAIVKSHGGSIAVQSTAAAGTIFEATFPK